MATIQDIKVGSTNYNINAYKTISRGFHTETASSTAANSPTTGMADTEGMFMTETYQDSATPTNYGNIINVAGQGTGQLLLS